MWNSHSKIITFYYRLINILPNICKQNAHIFTQILYTKCNCYFSYSLAETFSWCWHLSKNFPLLSPWKKLQLSHEILSQAVRFMALQLQKDCSSSLHLRALECHCHFSPNSQIHALKSHTLFSTFPKLSHLTAVCLCHHAPLKVQQTVFCWS